MTVVIAWRIPLKERHHKLSREKKRRLFRSCDCLWSFMLSQFAVDSELHTCSFINLHYSKSVTSFLLPSLTGHAFPTVWLHSFLSTPLLTVCLLVCQAGDLGASLTQMAWPFLFIHATFSRQLQRFIACLSWSFFQILIKIPLSFKKSWSASGLAWNGVERLCGQNYMFGINGDSSKGICLTPKTSGSDSRPQRVDN